MCKHTHTHTHTQWHTHTHTQTHKDTQTNTHTQPHDHGKFLKNKWLNQKEAQRRRGTELALFKDAPKRRALFCFFSHVTPNQMHRLKFLYSFFEFFLRRGARNDSQLQHRGSLAAVRLWKAKKKKTAFVPLGMTLRRAHKNIQGDSWCTHGPRLSRMI